MFWPPYVKNQLIEENPKAVDDYHNGEKGALNFLMGQVMRLTKGKADPRETVKILKELLEDGFITQEEYDAKRKAIIEEV